MPSKKFIAIFGTVAFLSIALFAVQIGVKGVQAIERNYALHLENLRGGDLDRDGIPDLYDDSDGDTIPDKYDAVPFKVIDSVVDFTLQ